MDEDKIPSSSHESGELVLKEENQVLKPPPRKKKSLRKNKMEAEISRRINASHSGKAEDEQLKTSEDDKMVQEQPLSINVDNNNINTADLGDNLEVDNSEALQPPAQQPSNGSQDERKSPNSLAQNKSDNEAIKESKAEEMPKGFSGCKMTTLENGVSKIQKRNMKKDNNNIDEVLEEGQDTMGNKNGSLKSKAKNTETFSSGNTKVIQNDSKGIKDSSSGHQTTNNAVVVSENFESFCLVENVAKSNEEKQDQNTSNVDQNSREISLSGEGNCSKSYDNSETTTSGIQMNYDNSDPLKKQCVNNPSCDGHDEDSLQASKKLSQNDNNCTGADDKDMMLQLQVIDNNTAVAECNLKQNNSCHLMANDVESQNDPILNFQNPLFRVDDSGIKTDVSVEKEQTQKQCNTSNSTDYEVLNQGQVSEKDSKGMSGNPEIIEGEKDFVPYHHIEDIANKNDTCEDGFGDDEEYSTDTDSDDYYSDFTSSEGEYDMEDAEKLCYTDDDKKQGNSPVSKEVEPESIAQILSAFQDSETVTVTDDTDGENYHGDGGHGGQVDTAGLELSEDRAQSLKRKIGSFKVVKGLKPAVDKADVKEASVGMTTELVTMETDPAMDTTKTAELAILALHKEHKQKHQRKEREREKRKSHEVITRDKSSEKLEISRPRSLVGEPRTRSRSTGDLDDAGQQKRRVKKQYSLPASYRARSLKLAGSSELDFDEREETPHTYPPGVLKGGLIASLSHLEESRERRDSGTPLIKQSSIKRGSEPSMVTEVGPGVDFTAKTAKTEEKDTLNIEAPSIASQSEVPGQGGEFTPQGLQEQSSGDEDNLTTIIQVDKLDEPESPGLRRALSTVREESSSSLDSGGSFSISSRGSSISQDKKSQAEEANSVVVGSDTSSNSNMGMIECENAPATENMLTKLENWEKEIELQNEELIENEKSEIFRTSFKGVDMTTPIPSKADISKKDHELSKSAPTTRTNFLQKPSSDGDITKLSSSVENVQRRQMKITKAKRLWLSQSAVVTSGLPQSSTEVKMTGFKKNGESDLLDSGALDLQISKSPDEENNHAKEKAKQVSFGLAPNVQGITPGDVTPKRPPRKGKGLTSSASFASPRTTRADTNRKPKRENVNKRREGGSRWQTLSGAIDADWLARLSSANKLPTEQMSDEIITLVTDAIPANFPAFPTDKRAQIALELYTTERTYVRGLEIVIELFKNQLEEYLEPKEKSTMFSNIDEIFKVNKDILFSLCEKVNHWKDTQMIGDIFVDNGDRFKIYATYCNNYDAAENLIKQKIKKKKEFEDFLEACYKNVVCQPGLKLPAYLITVVQRIPRYLLLLRDLVKCTPANHPDARPIKEGLRKMNNIAEYINNQLQAVQGQRAMTELRSRVIGIKAFETAGKSLIKEGEVYIMSTKRTYKCLLFNDMVVFAAKNVNKRSEVELTLELESIWVADLEDNDPQTSKEDAIELYTPERSYTVYTGTRNEKKHWLQKLRTAIAIRLHGEMATDSSEIAHRKSAFTYKDGRIYCGAFVDAKRHGHGVVAWQNRTRYVGNFEDDERNGIGELTYSTGEKYNGEWLDDKQHGVGTLTYPNKDIYTGEWERGKMNGKGLINFSNEDILDGEFVDNEVCGIARLTCVSGLTYEGTWKNSKKHGKGKLVKPNGDTYEGDFSNDRMSGTGTMVYASNEAKYEGQWENNQRHGTGIYTAPDGTRYEGEWRGDHMSGRGKMLYANGETYDGSWYKDMRFGKGILCCREGIYEGKFEYNVRHGFGIIKYSDNSEYEGEWQHDQRHGQGKMLYADSSLYEGNWMLGLRHGRGKMTFSNGATYEGNWDLGSEHGSDGVFIDTANSYSYEGGWEYGCKQGQGVERTSRGTYEGDFKANMRHGKGVETLRCGTVYEGHWRDNRKVGEIIRRTRWGETETTTELQYWKEGQLLNKDETIAPDLPFIQRITNK